MKRRQPYSYSRLNHRGIRQYLHGGQCLSISLTSLHEAVAEQLVRTRSSVSIPTRHRSLCGVLPWPLARRKEIHRSIGYAIDRVEFLRSTNNPTTKRWHHNGSNAERTSDRADGGKAADKSGDCVSTIHQSSHRRIPPQEGVSEARESARDEISPVRLTFRRQSSSTCRGGGEAADRAGRLEAVQKNADTWGLTSVNV